MRKSQIERKTTETQIKIDLDLDGKGNGEIFTTIPFMDHMLALFVKHSGIDLFLEAKGDTHIDDHHTVEDIGICLGDAIKEALGDKAGIIRYGCCLLPMDETLVETALDISGRQYFVYNVSTEERFIKEFDVELVEEFFRALINRLGITLHVNLRYGKNAHHVYEGVFKSFAVSFRKAIAIGGTSDSVPSSKGVID